MDRQGVTSRNSSSQSIKGKAGAPERRAQRENRAAALSNRRIVREPSDFTGWL